MPPLEKGDPIRTLGLAEVLEPRSGKYAKGDIVSALLHWGEELVIPESSVSAKVDKSLPYEWYLSVIGLTGLTAYFGLKMWVKFRKAKLFLSLQPRWPLVPWWSSSLSIYLRHQKLWELPARKKSASGSNPWVLNCASTTRTPTTSSSWTSALVRAFRFVLRQRGRRDLELCVETYQEIRPYYRMWSHFWIQR